MKSHLRTHYKAARACLLNKPVWSESILDVLKERLSEVSGPIGAYAPVGAEIDPIVVLEAIHRDIALPCVEGKDMVFKPWARGQQRQLSVLGIMEPVGGVTLIPQALLIPLLACDYKGTRLGYGGGYYDRYLRQYPDILKIGIGFSTQYLPMDLLPKEEHDQTLDAFIAPDGIVEF